MNPHCDACTGQRPIEALCDRCADNEKTEDQLDEYEDQLDLRGDDRWYALHDGWVQQ